MDPSASERKSSPQKTSPIAVRKMTNSPKTLSPPHEKDTKDEVFIVPVDDYGKSTVYKDNAVSFRTDMNQNDIFKNIQMLIEDTRYTSNNLVKTYNLYKKYCKHFVIEEKQIEKHGVIERDKTRVRIFAILSDELYPYYVKKYGSITKEMFVMAILYYYFSVRHSNDVGVSGYIYGRKTEDTKKFNNILIFLSTFEPKLSNLLLTIHGGKPKTKKNKQRRRKTRKTRKY